MTQIIMAASAPALSAELMFEVVVEGGEERETAAVDDGGGDTAVVGVGLEEQTALKKRPEPSGSGKHWPLGNFCGSGEPWLH